ncbi:MULTISPECIES: DNA-binding transcriptional regulator [Giesbergeria]|uniref:DNA-binding transcriptional regulator n=1 Tax=Giesbergeria sinuosa TaxID=80883 RepID=A0ABV9QBI0_9BURK
MVAKDLQYKEVRGLSRGLGLIRALNRMPGGFASTSELARLCGIHRTTAKRLLETLRAEGLVRSGSRDGQYHLTQDVRQLSEGFCNDAWIAQVAAPLLRSAVRELLWPCDLATVQAGWMIVRESTHRWSMLSQHHAMPGDRMPLLSTALGRAYLAACSAEELEALLCYLDENTAQMDVDPCQRRHIHQIVGETRTRGFAFNDGEWSKEPHFAAVAVPLLSAGCLLGALNMVFPKNAMSLTEITERYVPKLQLLAVRIGAHISLPPTH